MRANSFADERRVHCAGLSPSDNRLSSLRSGGLDQVEMQAVLVAANNGRPCTPAAAASVLDKADIDRDGRVGVVEFYLHEIRWTPSQSSAAG